MPTLILAYPETRYNYQTRLTTTPRIFYCFVQRKARPSSRTALAPRSSITTPSIRATRQARCRYWFEAERTKHKVGGAQKETDEEKADALKRGKAVSAVIGTRAMGALLGFYKSTTPPANSSGLPSSTCSRISSANRGLRGPCLPHLRHSSPVSAAGTRFNVLMTIQIPLEQTKLPTCHGGGLLNTNFLKKVVKSKGSMMGGMMGGMMEGGGAKKEQEFDLDSDSDEDWALEVEAGMEGEGRCDL